MEMETQTASGPSEVYSRYIHIVWCMRYRFTIHTKQISVRMNRGRPIKLSPINSAPFARVHTPLDGENMYVYLLLL